jgi:hypothetical protein
MFLAVGHFERQNTLRQTVHIRNPTGLSMAGTSPPAAEATADGADGEQMAKKPPVDGTLQTPSPVDDTLDADTDSDADSDAEDGVRADGVRADVRADLSAQIAAAADDDQKTRLGQISWKFSPTTRAFFKIVRHIKPRGKGDWKIVAAQLQRHAAEYNREAAQHDAPKMCQGALHCTADQLQRRWNFLQSKRKPTGNPSKHSDVEEAQKIHEEIMAASHQGQVGNTTYVEAQAQYEIGSLTADGKCKLSQASSDSSAEKKSGGTRFFKALEEMTSKTEVLEDERRQHADKLEHDRKLYALELEHEREVNRARRHEEAMGLARQALDIFAKLLGPD